MKQTNCKIKICGLKREADILTANELALDYVGFVFAAKSKRYVSPQQAETLKGMLQDGIQAVGVFVNEDPLVVAELLKRGVIDIAQLHGTENDAYISDLRALLHREGGDSGGSQTSTRIWQAFRIDEKADIDKANASTADLVLLDHGPGGTGEAFDWTWLSGMQRPYMLAGGLTPENVSEALAQTADSGMLYGLDISSGVETDHLKDPDKMRAFVNNVRS